MQVEYIIKLWDDGLDMLHNNKWVKIKKNKKIPHSRNSYKFQYKNRGKGQNRYP